MSHFNPRTVEDGQSVEEHKNFYYSRIFLNVEKKSCCRIVDEIYQLF